MYGTPSASTATPLPRPASSRNSATKGTKRSPSPLTTSPSGIEPQAAAVRASSTQDDRQALGHVGGDTNKHRGRCRTASITRAGRARRRSRAAAADVPAPPPGTGPCASHGFGGNGLGRARRDDLASLVTTLRPEVDQPVGGLDHVEVVLDHEHGVAGRDEPLEHREELADVLEVQTRGGLVEHVQRVAGRPLVQLGAELDALGLAARQRRRRLPELARTRVRRRRASACAA